MSPAPETVRVRGVNGAEFTVDRTPWVDGKITAGELQIVKDPVRKRKAEPAKAKLPAGVESENPDESPA